MWVSYAIQAQGIFFIKIIEEDYVQFAGNIFVHLEKGVSYKSERAPSSSSPSDTNLKILNGKVLNVTYQIRGFKKTYFYENKIKI